MIRLAIRYYYWMLIGRVVLWLYTAAEGRVIWYRKHAPLCVVTFPGDKHEAEKTEWQG